MNIRRIVIGAAAALAAGCAGPSPHPALERAAALEHWTVTALPPVHRAIPSPRIAVIELSLQYAPPEPPVDVASSARLEVPGLVYGVFEAVARDAGRILCPRDDVRAALLDRGVKGGRFEEIRMTASPVAESSRWIPVEGLLVLDDDDAGLEPSVLQVVGDTGADFALQVRLKVTLRNGRALILPGSTLRAFSVHGPARLETTKAFVSESALPPGGAVRSSEFAEVLLQVVRPFFRTAMAATARED